MTESLTNEKRSVRLLLWIPLGLLLGLLIIFLLVFPAVGGRHWPPPWLERRAQREFVFTNIEAEGGWTGFKSECDSLISQSRKSGQSQWFSPPGVGFPNSLIGDKFPASYKIISSLKPVEIDIVAADNKPAYVSIQVFGLHRTGGHDTPMYLLVYQQVTNSDGCIAADLFSVIKLKPRKITDSIFEIY